MKILTVCLGNICRSPLAQGLLEQKIAQRGLDWKVDSAGTSGWHDGERPDPRAIQTAQKNGINISKQISRKITNSDFEEFDYILAMDSSNYNDLTYLAGRKPEYVSKIFLATHFLYPGRNVAVPDPYYDNRFDEVFELLDKALDRFIETVTTIEVR
ncbi:MAG: low molecular weight phosphotyrosine protein phosphatase [Saprospiraceae bacterium]|nr:low molecular weight phosphotyrosine protein phosphatase [Saprospiraceae bacterium]